MRILMTVLLVLFLESEYISAYTYNISVYPLSRWVYEEPIYVFWDSRTWLEAQESCKIKEMLFYHGWSRFTFHDFVMTQALKQNRSDFKGIWVGNIKPLGSDSYFRANGCLMLDTSPDVITNTSADRLCYMLNATAGMEKNVYAVPCTLKFAYACHRPRSLYTDVPNAYILSKNSRIIQASLRKTTIYNNETLDGCINKLFSKENVLAEYEDTMTGHSTCQLYTCDSYNLPTEISLANDTEDVTIITGSYKTVIFDEDTTDITPSSTLSLCDIVLTSPTQNEGTTTDISTANTPHTESKTCCMCTKNLTLTEKEVNEKLKQLQQELSLETKTLSLNKRKLISAPDERTSSKGIGFVAIIILVLVGCILILSDIAFCNVNLLK